MIDKRRIKKINELSKDGAYSFSIREALRGIAYQLTRNPSDTKIVTDNIRVNTILNDIGIKTSVREEETKEGVRLLFSIDKKNPIPGRYFNYLHNDYLYYMNQNNLYWFIGIRKENEDYEDIDMEEEEMEDDYETSYVIVDKIIDIDFNDKEELNRLLRKSKSKIKGKNSWIKEDITYEKLKLIFKDKPENKFNLALAESLFTAYPLSEMTENGAYSDPFLLFSFIAEVIKTYEKKIDEVKGDISKLVYK